MSYLVNEVFSTVQGEGYWSGRAATFIRFAKCNLWTGREEDRATAICTFCDTDFVHGERMELEEILDRIPYWHTDFVVLTGGEPTLQVNDEFIDALHERGCYVAIETNGTRRIPKGIDWVCVSPKAGAPLVGGISGDELKVVYPQPLSLDALRGLPFKHFWLSPMDGPNLAENTKTAVDYVLEHPWWRLNTQTHKVIGVR